MPASNKSKEILYRVSFRNICAGVMVRDDVVVQAAPVLRRFVGKPWRDLWHWIIYRPGEKSGKVEKLDASTEA